MPTVEEHRWHPIARVDDAPFRHVFHGKLEGLELAVWRADDGFVNVWENRCLHRGVRLSLGSNRGTELACQYHGWRYMSRTGGCTYIPAHPADAPARTVCTATFPVVERYGLIWTTRGDAAEPAPIPTLDAGSWLALQCLPFNASMSIVRAALANYRFNPTDANAKSAAIIEQTPSDADRIELVSRGDGHVSSVVLFIQPVDLNRCVVRPVLAGRPPDTNRLAVLRHHSDELRRVRQTVEALAAQFPPDEPADTITWIVRAGPTLADEDILMMPISAAPTGRVVVKRKWQTAEGIAAFELAPLSGHLETTQPGGHLDVQLPNGLTRQYSIANLPAETGTYVIGVKLEPTSRGGSSCLHNVVQEGDVLGFAGPRHNFSLRRDAARTILIAGGIGITPLLSMALRLHHDGLRYELHYFAQNDASLAFLDVLNTLGDATHRHLGLDPAATGSSLASILAEYAPNNHVYICGPGPMLDAARRCAADNQWPDDAVHFEYFKNTNVIDDSTSFEISLARSAMTLQVHAGETILEVLNRNGVQVPSSCSQGACGTCLVPVIEGEPDHHDVFLNESEHAAGRLMLPCVSRSKSDILVLDI